ncbi:MAG: hypothetical protein GY711_13075 [bacterium]|nr:hypothetical protein [bacterium]
MSPAKEQKALTWVHWFFFVIVFSAGTLFFYKLYTFLSTIKNDEMAGFAFDPIVIYGCVALGFLCLLGWAYLSGQFRNVEQPKYEMLERWAKQEKEDVRILEEHN